MLCRTLSVVACNKVGDDGEQVLLELPGTGVGSGVVAIVNHDELAFASAEDVLDELDRNAGEAVSMEDHNLADAS